MSDVLAIADRVEIEPDRCERTGEGWKFAEPIYEARYLDSSPLAGSAPDPA